MTTADAVAPNASVNHLKVNADPEALGIDDATPTLSWRIESDERGVSQAKYRIAVASTEAKAEAGQADVWDTGVVASDSTAVDYAGPALDPRTRYYWSVMSWTPDATTWSEAGYFETALLDPDQWQGDWISGQSRPTLPVTAADGVADDAGLLPSSNLTRAAEAGATNIKVINVAGATVGSQVVVGLGTTGQTVTLTEVGTATSTTTLAAPAAAGDTRLYVAGVTGLSVGGTLVVGPQTLTVTEVGTAAGANRTLAAPAAATDTNIKVNNAGGFTVGQKVLVGSGAAAVVRTVTVIGTATATGTGIDLDSPLGAPFASGASARGLGTGVGVTALTTAAAQATVVLSPGTGLTFTPALTAAVPAGGSVRNPASTDVCRQVGNSTNSGSCKPVRPNFLLRKSFDVAPVSQHGAVTKARLYSTGLGWSEPRINGDLAQPGDHLNPGFTDYKDSVQYTTDDVTGLIKQSATGSTVNVVASELAAGRYNSETVPSNHRFELAQWRNLETLRADLYLTYADGTEQLVKSDDSWKVSTAGPTRYADFDDGEVYDARQQLTDWAAPTYDASSWSNANVNPGPAGELVAQVQERTSVVDELEGPFTEWSPSAGVRAFDIGRQITGWATIKVWGAKPGQIIRTAYVERRNDDLTKDDPAIPGTGQDGDLQFAGQLQQDYYVSDGTGTEADPEVFAPNWNFAGFQWVQVDGGGWGGTAGFSAQPGTPIQLPDSVHVAIDSVQQVRTDQPKVGTFETDVDLLNKIYGNVERAVEGDWIAGYSMDTPTYEKDGWTGDAQIILPTVANIFDIQRSMLKSAHDSVESQLANGQVGLLIPGSEGYGYCSPSSPTTPNVYVPCGNTPSLNVFKASGGGATPIWDAFLMVTSSEAYLRYADTAPMATAFGAMTNYLDDNIQGGKPYSQGPGGWFTLDGSDDWTLNSGLGDWAFVTGADGNAAEGTNLNVGGFQAASSTAFTAFLATQTAEMADVLYDKTGIPAYKAEGQKYRRLFQSIRTDFNKRWWDADRGFYAENATQELRQGFQAWAIGFGLVEEQNKRDLEEKLAYDVAVTRTGHAMIGFVGIRWIWPVLSEAAHDGVPYAKEALFKVAQQTTYPSYGYHVNLGYTGVGEYWEASTRTRNHQFQGSIGQWFYEELAGIKPAAPGYKEIQIRPLVGGEYGVHEVTATHESIHGMIGSSWVDGDDGLTLKVTIPANTTAKIHVPSDGTQVITESGSGTSYLAAKAPGVTLVGPEDDAVVYAVGSGDYVFKVGPAGELAASTVTAPAATGTYGTPTRVTATVTGEASPTGTVTLVDGARTVASGAVESGTATLTIPGTALTAGSHPLRLLYSGDDSVAGSEGTLTVRIAKATSALATTVQPQRVTTRTKALATVRVTARGVTPTGAVRILRGTKVIGRGTLNKAGAVAIRLPRLAAGRRTLKVVYVGSANVRGVTRTIVIQVRRPAGR
ncbi:family 78 glycoside hydrolase catalytic domain [Nocardioides sp.]|uniref:family 78 glycoside hydrolase catalytic domain n=1 Tax=Nocardioides sp. TaxID=35761 RepID=UPI00271DD9B4|nr:family 78 glycoside hydrolase catalytic domain [Nocardioides sp.]MDO9457330.1 family 78 glycoside hydrolase catalytic domain [Nocardioides sp.]